MENASNAAHSGSESVGPFRGREGRPQPGATDLARGSGDLPILGSALVVRRTIFFLRMY